MNLKYKQLIYILWIVCFSGFARAQNYYVISVKDSVCVNGKLIKKKDRITLNDQLLFKNDNAQVALISPGKGRFVLTANKVERNTSGEFIAAVKETIVPAKKYRLTGSKGEITNSEQLSKFFAANHDPLNPNNFLIIGRGEYIIKVPEFPQSSNSYFYLSYNYNTEEVIIKLNYSGKVLYIDKSIYEINGQQIKPEEIIEMQLVYKDKIKKTKTLICNFKPVVADEDQIIEELKIIIDNYWSSDMKALYEEEVMSYLIDTYGTTEERKVKELLKREFFINID